jgi:L-asparagine oxygenase
MSTLKDRDQFRIQELELTAGESSDAIAIAAEAMRRYGDCNEAAFIAAAPEYAQHLPRRLIRFMNGVRRDDTTVAAILRGGWHPGLDELRTPKDWRHGRDTKAGNIQNFLLALCGSRLGEIFSWHGQQEGSLVHDLVPTYANRNDQLGSGSEAALCWHTEDAFHPCRGDFVILYSVRAKRDARSTLSWLRQGALTSETIAALMEDKYEFEPDTSYTDHRDFANKPVALLYGSGAIPHLRADSVYYKTPSGERERKALEELYAALDAALVEVEMSSGDMLILNNRRVVHGRSKFQARYDGNDRWVKRINIAEDLERSRAYRCCPASRIVHLGPQEGRSHGRHYCDLLRGQYDEVDAA